MAPAVKRTRDGKKKKKTSRAVTYTKSKAAPDHPIRKDSTFVGILRHHDFYKPDDVYKDNMICIYMVLKKLKSNKSSSLERTVSYLNFMYLMDNHLKTMAEVVLDEMNIKARPVQLPSQADKYFLTLPKKDLETWKSTAELQVIFGCSILVMFKNISTHSYMPFMTTRIDAMKAKAGIGRGTELKVPFSEKVAEGLNYELGASPNVKEYLIEYVLEKANYSTRLGTLCKYLLSILAFAEMTSFVILYKTLLVPNSPVLDIAELGAEVHLLHETYCAIASTEYPQFFKFYEGKTRTHLLNKNRWPLLLDIAMLIMIEEGTSTTLGNYVPASRVKRSTFKDFCVGIHARKQTRVRNKKLKIALSYLTGVSRFEMMSSSEEEEEPEQEEDVEDDQEGEEE
ncbi:hypothetical protein ACFE04_026309 [Oxalis oulophora]